MKKYWKLFALVMAVLLLCTACEERRVIDISDGGDGFGSATSAPAAKPAKTDEPSAAEKPAKEEPAKEEPAEKPEEKPADKADTAAPAVSGPTGKVKLVEMSMNAKAKGMSLVPVDNGAVFVLNNVLTDTCTITTDPKDYISASCKVNVEEGMDAALHFVLLQNDKEILSKDLDASLNQGENSIQVLVRLGSTVSGEYVGRLYVNGELIGESSVTA